MLTAGKIRPIYIAEVAPAAIRGLCTCIFTGAVYVGIVLAVSPSLSLLAEACPGANLL